MRAGVVMGKKHTFFCLMVPNYEWFRTALTHRLEELKNQNKSLNGYLLELIYNDLTDKELLTVKQKEAFLAILTRTIRTKRSKRGMKTFSLYMPEEIRPWLEEKIYRAAEMMGMNSKSTYIWQLFVDLHPAPNEAARREWDKRLKFVEIGPPDS